ncbi:MAG: elongation factor P [Candidatus Omnitrophota bacterium]|nr:elongation factor P [Candidatus Omnitrophota bacterium]
MKQAVDVKVGNLLLINGTIYKVEEVEIKGSAKAHKTINIKMRGILDGKYMEHTYHQEDKLDEADVVHKKALFSYQEGDTFHFLDEDTYEDYGVNREMIGEKDVFLKENEKYTVAVYEGSAIDVIFPERIRLKVTCSPPGIKQHDSITAKQVILENGMKIGAPQFIEEGDIVEVDSRTGKYIDRVQE